MFTSPTFTHPVWSESYFWFQGLAQGTVFSLRSRRQQDTYLSLELAGPDRVKLVHAGPNGTQAVDIPAALGDGKWHQLAVG